MGGQVFRDDHGNTILIMAWIKTVTEFEGQLPAVDGLWKISKTTVLRLPLDDIRLAHAKKIIATILFDAASQALTIKDVSR